MECHDELASNRHRTAITVMKTRLEQSPLGRLVPSPQQYDPDQLTGLDRADTRSGLDIPPGWHGADVWNAYELSWLNLRGKPEVAMGRFIIPCDSPRLIESKSLKLYLNSLNQERLDGAAAFGERVTADLSAAAGGPVTVQIFPLRTMAHGALADPEGISLDALDIAIEDYQPRPDLLSCRAQAGVVTETLTSDLLRSNCPVTGQPDWGSVQIRYTGPAMDHARLLAYIVSLRQHTGFHEHCVESIFCDIWHACRPTALAVSAWYLRRGGLDINPWRASHAAWAPDPLRTPRQ